MGKIINNMMARWNSASEAEHQAAAKKYPLKYKGVSMLMNQGGSEGGSGGGGGSSSYGGSGNYTSDMYANYLRYAPQLAAMDWEQTQKYLPLQAQLQLQMAGEYLPQQNELALRLGNEYQPQYTDLYARLRDQDRGLDLDSIQRLTPQLDTIRRLSEGDTMAGMRDTLQQQIMADLALGDKLGPEQTRNTEEYFRSGEFSRGLGTGGGSAAREAIVKSLEGRKLQNERQAKAQSVMSQDRAERYDPFMSIGNRPSTAMSMGASNYANSSQSPAYAGTMPNGFGMNTTLTGLAQNQQGLDNQANQFQQQMDLQSQQYNLQLQLAQANAMSQVGPLGQYNISSILGR